MHLWCRSMWRLGVKKCNCVYLSVPVCVYFSLGVNKGIINGFQRFDTKNNYPPRIINLQSHPEQQQRHSHTHPDEYWFLNWRKTDKNPCARCKNAKASSNQPSVAASSSVYSVTLQSVRGIYFLLINLLWKCKHVSPANKAVWIELNSERAAALCLLF